MLSALPQVLTPSAIAAADSLTTAPRSGTEGGSGFAALMQRQSELRLSDLRLSDLHSTEQRLAEQRQSQPRQAAPSATELRASVALPNAPGKPPGSGAGAEPGGGDANSQGGRSAAPDDRAGLNTSTGSTRTSSTPSAASSRPLDNSTESRNAASLSLNSKLQRARSAAPDATRQAAAGATPQRAGTRQTPTAAAEEDSGSPAPEPNRPDEPLLDPTAATATAATPPLPSAAAPDAEGVIQRGDSLSALGRTSRRLPVTGGAAEAAGLPGSSRSTAGWVADQQRLRDAGTRRPRAPDDAGLGKQVADLPDPAAGQQVTSATTLAADLLAPGLAGYPTSPSDLPSTVPGDGQAGAQTGAAAALAAAAANAGGRPRGAALPGTPDGSAPDQVPNLPGQPDQAIAGNVEHRAATTSPATRPGSPPAVSTAGATQTPDAGMSTRAAAPLTADSANQSAQLIDTGDNKGSNTDSTAMTGSVSVPPGTVPADAVVGARGDQVARRTGELAAVNSAAKANTLALAGAGQMSGLRTDATAVADGQPGQSATQASEVVGPNGLDSAARPTRPSPAADTTLASNPAGAPTDSSASANASTSAAERADPVAGADPRRALATAAGPDGAAISHRPAGGERVSALAGDSANTGATDPAAPPANHRAAVPGQIAGPLASAEPAALPASPASAKGAGPDTGLSRHPGERAAASDGGPAGLSGTTAAAAPVAASNRSDASSPNAAPVEARIAVPLDSPAFAPALGAQISLFARDGVQTARLQLNPAEMGPIAVQIAVDGNAARIDFQADRAATREVIEASLPALAGALQDAGLTLTGGGVFQQHPGRQAPAEPGPAPVAGRLLASGNGLDAVAGGLAASSRQRTPRGLVDLVA